MKEKLLDKEAYTHGLESIYNIETLDLKTIRPFQVSISEAVLVEIPSRQYELTLKLGDRFQRGMESFTLFEPITVLNLSDPLLETLEKKEIKLLYDVYPSFELEGIGHGHLDEIRTQFEFYTRQTPLNFSERVDYEALLRALLLPFGHAEAYKVVEPYELADSIPLSPKDRGKLFSLDVSKQKIVIDTSLIQRMVDAYVIPWVERRFGLASSEEILERLKQVSINPDSAEKVLNFLGDQGVLNWERYFEAADSETFATQEILSRQYQSVIKKAKSYFYKPQASFCVEILAKWIYREYALQWEGLSLDWIKKCLHLCPQFLEYKSEEGDLFIRELYYSL